MVLQRKDPETAKALHDLMDTDVSVAVDMRCCAVLCCVAVLPSCGPQQGAAQN